MRLCIAELAARNYLQPTSQRVAQRHNAHALISALVLLGQCKKGNEVGPSGREPRSIVVSVVAESRFLSLS